MERFTGEAVEALNNQPRLAADLEYVMQHYLLLNRARPSSFSGIAAIPLSEIDAMYRMAEMHEVMTAGDFIGYVQFLDDIFKEWHKVHSTPSK